MINFNNEFEFLKLAENLKLEMRHSWLSKNRQESVAEHCWRLSLMAYRYADQLDQPVDLKRCVLMAIVHDLAEAITGDIPVFDSQTSDAKAAKDAAEQTAMLTITKLLGNDTQAEAMLQLWEEYEKQACYESRFVRALDKLEVFIQHLEAPISTWEEREKHMIYQDKWLRKFCTFDSFLNRFCDEVIARIEQKLKEAGEDLMKLKQQAIVLPA